MRPRWAGHRCRRFVAGTTFSRADRDVLAVFSKLIARSRAQWCLAAPLLVVLAWAAAEYWLLYRSRDFSLVGYLGTEAFRERAVIVGLVATNDGNQC
jgi:hypothetical protein